MKHFLLVLVCALATSSAYAKEIKRQCIMNDMIQAVLTTIDEQDSVQRQNKIILCEPEEGSSCTRVQYISLQEVGEHIKRKCVKH